MSYQSQPSTIVDLLRWRALSQPTRLAYSFLADGEAAKVDLTYEHLDIKARAIGALLQSLEPAGSRVLLLYPPGLEYITGFFGCLYAGMIAIPAFPPRINRSPLRLQNIIKDAQATVALTTGAVLSNIKPLLIQDAMWRTLRWINTEDINTNLASMWQRPVVNSETAAFLQYTSGSTTTPRGVIVSHDNVLQNERMIQYIFQQTEDSIIVSWLPLYHDMGLIGSVLQPLYIGASAILLSPMAFLQRPSRWLEVITHYKATTSGGPNFAYELCVKKVTPQQRASLDLSSWTVAFNGSEPICAETLENFAAAFEPHGFRKDAFYPCYGLAEATLFVSGRLKNTPLAIATVQARALEQNRVIESPASREPTRSFVSCGKPIFEEEVIIVCPEQLSKCSSDEVGEIWVAGPNVAKGYWNKDEETAYTYKARIIEPGEDYFLRTGDLGFLRNGELFVTGRLKDLIIIRGLNYYPEDIERTVQRCHTALRRGAGAAFTVTRDWGGEQLIVIQELDRNYQPDIEMLADIIRQEVADQYELYIDSVVFIRYGSIPRTSSGKIQRHACKSDFLARSLDVIGEDTLERNSISSPESTLTKELFLNMHPAERKVELISYLRFQIAQILGLSPSRVHLHHSLSRLGLDSIMATSLSTLLAERMQLELSPVDLMRGISIAELEGKILTSWAAENDGDVGNVIKTNYSARRSRQIPLLKPYPREGHPPLSFAQQRLWLLDQLQPGSAFYTIPIALQLSGRLELSALEQGLSMVVRRHEILRTTFPIVDGQPVQFISENVSLKLSIIDLREVSKERQNAEMQRITASQAQKSFDLSVGPLLRASLLVIGKEAHILFITLHHIIGDGWSGDVFVQELVEAYEGFSNQGLRSLSALSLQYADFSQWQRQWLQGEILDAELSYWKKQLAGSLPLLDLPIDRPRQAIQSFRGARYHFTLSSELSASLKDLGRQEESTLFMVLLTALQILLYRYSRQRDICIGTVVHGRNWAEIQRLIGFFANTLVIRADLSGDLSFRNLLKRTREAALGAYDHQHLPFEKLVEMLNVERGLSFTPLFQVMFILHNELNAAVGARDGSSFSLSRRPELEETGTSKRDLSFSIMDEPRGLIGTLEYDGELFDSSSITRVAERFRILLGGIVSDPDQIISTFSLLSVMERHQILWSWNSRKITYPLNKTILQLLEMQVELVPDAIALVHKEEHLTYRLLNGRANQLARHLQTLGVHTDVLVGICLSRSLEMVIGILGALKAGGAYVPLDLAYPNDHLTFILRDAKVTVLISQERSIAMQLQTDVHPLSLSADWHSIEQQSDANLDNSLVSSENLAYVVYTSGSTGRPKGVMISHGGLCQYIQSLQSSLNIMQSDLYLHTASIAFSSSVRQVMMPLSQGATAVIASSEEIMDPLALFQMISRQEITVIDLVPSYWRNCIHLLSQLEAESRKAILNNKLRLVLSASEPLSIDIAATWKIDFKHDAYLINMLGHTETAGIVATYPVHAGMKDGLEIVPVGRPIANTSIYLLDSHFEPVPVGVPGDIYISGDSLARCYLNRPELTAESFIPAPFCKGLGIRMYKTGDLARFQADGTIEFLGRTDHQIKIRGFRVDPGEIEAALRGYPQVQQVIVLAQKDVLGERRLVSYLVVNKVLPPSIVDLRGFLRGKLPNYMIPSTFITLDSLPCLPNGKVDRRALLESNSRQTGSSSTFDRPPTVVEKTLLDIWSDVLKVECIGVHDNFFDLGGHSLLAMQVISRVRDVFKIELPLRKLFEAPTISDLAHVVRQPDNTPRQVRRKAISPRLGGRKNIEQLVADLESLSENEGLSQLNLAGQDEYSN